MHRIVPFLCAVLLVVVGLGSNSPKEYDDATKNEDLQGVWRVVGNEEGGKRIPFGGLGIQTIQGNKWVYNLDGRILYEGVFTIDNSRKPAALDETDTAGAAIGRTRKFIYRIEGNTLWMAFNRADPLTRPRSFEENGLFVITWKRVEK
jgi:uncharacterized protein (TIGR03067 family)